MNDDSQSIFERIKKIINSLIWDLPFENYHKYYKTGIIQKMSNQEKIDFFFERHKNNSKKLYFKRIINLRPNILDDDDLFKYKEIISKGKKNKGIYLSLFFLNNTIHFYLLLIKKTSYMKSLVGTNILFLFAFPFLDMKTHNMFDDLYVKYRLIYDEDELYKKFQESSSIE